MRPDLLTIEINFSFVMEGRIVIKVENRLDTSFIWLYI